MKKLLAIAALLVASAVSYAQGTVNFGNIGGSFDAPIFDVDTTTRLAGPGFMAQLYVKSGETYTAVGAALPFFSVESGGAGYIDNTSGPDRSIPGIAGGAQATLVIRAWDLATGATWDSALHRGQSADVTIALGGAGSPPSLPADLTGLQSFSLVVVPEPSTIALAMLGGAALFLRRRK